MRVIVRVLLVVLVALVALGLIQFGLGCTGLRDTSGHRVTSVFDLPGALVTGNYVLKSGHWVPAVLDEDLAPVVSFTSGTLDGSVVSSDDFRSADLVVYVRWADWCLDCDELLGVISELLRVAADESVMFVSVPYISGVETSVDTVMGKLQEYPVLVDSSQFISVVWNSVEAASVFGVSPCDIPYLCITTGSGSVLWRGSYLEFGKMTSFASGLGMDLGSYPILTLAAVAEENCSGC